MAGRVTQLVVEAVIAPTSAAVRTTQVAVEAVISPDAAAVRTTQLVVEAVVSPTSAAVRTTQLVVEAVVAPEPNLVVSFHGLEVARFGDPNVLISQSGLEVARAGYPNLSVSQVGMEVAWEPPKGTFTLGAWVMPQPVTRTFGTKSVFYGYAGAPIVIKEGQKGSPVEFVIPGCDLTIAGSPITITWDVWQSHFQWGTDKKEVVRLRRDSLTGLVMWTDDPQKEETDAGNAATGTQWHFSGTYQETARSGRYVLTVLPAKGNATLYASSIFFGLATPGDGPGITFDAISRKTTSRSFSIDARILQPTGPITMPDATTADAAIKGGQAGSFSVGAILYVWGLGAFVSSATVLSQPVASFTVGAEKYEAYGGGFISAGSFGASALTGPHTGETTADAVIFAPQSGSFGVDAFFPGTASIDAWIKAIGLCVWTTPGDTVVIGQNERLAFLIPFAYRTMVFEIQLDRVATFDSPELRRIHSILDPGWEYWDGAWVPMSSLGVDPAFAGNEARYTIVDPLLGGTWYRRVRAGVI